MERYDREEKVKVPTERTHSTTCLSLKAMCCVKQFKSRRITCKFFAHYLKKTIELNPATKVTELVIKAKAGLEFDVGYHMVKRAKKKVLTEL